MILNDKIKASEVHLTGVDGEDLGIVPTKEALKMARSLKVDLVCMSLMSSPPPARLIKSGAVKEQAQQERKRELPAKVKEIRLTPRIEEHDLDTKRRQAERLLLSGDSVQLVIKIQGKEGSLAKEVLQALIRDLKHAGRPAAGIQLSGKQASVQINALTN